MLEQNWQIKFNVISYHPPPPNRPHYMLSYFVFYALIYLDFTILLLIMYLLEEYSNTPRVDTLLLFY
jgi:hypothetical protein